VSFLCVANAGRNRRHEQRVRDAAYVCVLASYPHHISWSNSGAVGLFSYGEGFLGSLGTGSYDDVAEPSRLPATRELNVKQLSAGW
jgi:hypothetical protein